MINTINFSEFADSFSDQYKNNFSYEGKKALFEHLENLESENGTQIELDPIAFCCEYSEYDDLKDLQANYSNINTMEDLENSTTVIPIEGSDRFIIQEF